MKYKLLKEICTIQTGKLDANMAVKNGKYPFFTCAKNPSRIDTYAYDCNCVLLAGNGEFNVNLYSGKFNAYQRTYIIQMNDETKYSIKLLYYIIKKNVEKLEKMSNGGIIKFIKIGDVQNIKFPDISLNEQMKIISILDKISSIKDLDARQLDLYEEVIINKFLEMFGDPIINKKNFLIKKLKDLSIKISNGTTPKGGDLNYTSSGIVFIRSQNVLRNKIDYSDVVYISKETNDSMKNSILQNGDLLITKTGRINTENSSLGRPALFDGKNYSANINGHVYMVRLKQDVNKKYILSILLMPQYKEYIRSVCVGGTDKRQLNKNHIEEFPIIYPPIKLQEEYSTFVESVNKLKDAVQCHLDFTQELLNKKMDEFFGEE